MHVSCIILVQPSSAAAEWVFSIEVVPVFTVLSLLVFQHAVLKSRRVGKTTLNRLGFSNDLVQKVWTLGWIFYIRTLHN